MRPLVAPQGPPAQNQAATGAAALAECAVESGGEPFQARPRRINWARRLERVFEFHLQHCRNCGAGEFKIIAAILERPVIDKILTCLGLDAQPPPRAPARGPGRHHLG